MLRKIKLLLLFSILTLNTNQVLAQKFAVIGDYGEDGGNELAVANLVKSWSPDFIITVGDNNYDNGEASTIDNNVGKYYADWILPYSGTFGLDTATTNKFFPVPGNHDWDASPLPAGDLTPYLDYFTLPNNERYYDFVWGDLHFFMIDSDSREPDGNTLTSVQALWIKEKMESSVAKWKIVVLHHPPYSSTGSSEDLRWPFKTWGADAVFAGHKHNYERLTIDGLVYFVDGLGGKSRQSFGSTITGSEVRYNADYGAMLIDATSSNISFAFYNKSGTQIDSYEITDPTPVELVYFAGNLNGSNVELHWRTETEVNNYGFDIERIKDNLDRLTIGFVEGHGNSNSPNYYSFSDNDINQSGSYQYRLKQIDNDGTYEYSNVITVEVGVPGNFYLSQNYPNPFNPVTNIRFTISELRFTILKVYDVLGNEVATIVNEEKSPGMYEVEFNAENLSNGFYFYQLTAGTFSEKKKMILLK